MYPELRVTPNEQMDMIDPHFQAQDFCLMLSTYLANDLRYALCDRLYQYLAPILRTPHHMVLARVEHVPIGLVGDLRHRDSIQHEAIYYQLLSIAPPLKPRNKERALYPWG